MTPHQGFTIFFATNWLIECICLLRTIVIAKWCRHNRRRREPKMSLWKDPNSRRCLARWRSLSRIRYIRAWSLKWPTFTGCSLMSSIYNTRRLCAFIGRRARWALAWMFAILPFRPYRTRDLIKGNYSFHSHDKTMANFHMRSRVTPPLCVHSDVWSWSSSSSLFFVVVSVALAVAFIVVVATPQPSQQSKHSRVYLYTSLQTRRKNRD